MTKTLRELHEAATPAPDLTFWRYKNGGGRVSSGGNHLVADFYDEANRELFYALWPALPLLLDVVDAAREARKGLGGYLWLANNIDNAARDPLRFREFFDAATNDSRRAYDAVGAALAALDGAA